MDARHRRAAPNTAVMAPSWRLLSFEDSLNRRRGILPVRSEVRMAAAFFCPHLCKWRPQRSEPVRSFFVSFMLGPPDPRMLPSVPQQLGAGTRAPEKRVKRISLTADTGGFMSTRPSPLRCGLYQL